MFDSKKLYLSNDPALKALGTYWLLATWRSEGRGPAYIKIGARVAYRGSDLNEWLEMQTVLPVRATA